MRNLFIFFFVVSVVVCQITETKKISLSLTNKNNIKSVKVEKKTNMPQMKAIKSKEYILKEIEVEFNNIDPFLGVAATIFYSGEDNNLEIFLQGELQDGSYTEWKKFERFDLENSSKGIFKGDLLYMPKNVKKLHFKVVIKDISKQVTLKNIEIFYVSPGATPKEEQQKYIQESQIMIPEFKLYKGKSIQSYPRPSYVSRNTWGASLGLTNTNSSRTTSTITHLVLHNSAGDTYASDYAAVVRSYYSWHVNGNGWSDIGYNWLVDPNGVVYQGRAWQSSSAENVVGAHNSGYNTNTLGLNIIGDYQTYQPTQASLDKMAQLMAFLCDKFQLNPTGNTYFAPMGVNKDVITGHKHSGGGTDCPGQYLIAKYSWFRTTVSSLLSGGSITSGVTLSSPSDGSKHLGITPTMSWQSYSGASSYQLQVSTSSTFSSTVINQSGITGTSYTVGSNILNYGVTYYWRVKANNSSDWSAVWVFTTSGMKPLVEKKSSNNSLPSWFGGASTDNTERGMAYTDNEILVVSRKNSVSIKRLKWDDLSDIGELNISGVSGGTYILNDVETSWDGKILACNLVINNTQTFKIYKWDNVTSSPVEYISYNNTSGYRLGDNFTVYGSLSSNAAIYVPAGNNNKILKWTVSNGVLNSTPTVITLTLPSGLTQLNSPVSIAPYGYGNENFYVNAPNVNPILYNSSGAIQGTIDGGVIPQASTTIKTFVVGNKRYLMAFLSNNTAGDPNGQNLIIVDVTDGPSGIGSEDIYGKSVRLGDVSNSNMAGDLCYRAADGKYTVYVLSTNNGIGAYECMIAPLPVELEDGSFKGYITGNGVKLEWVTRSELNNDRFEIERLDGEAWKKVGEVLGQGTSNISKRYEFEDKQIARQRVLRYRLKQVDNDGSYKYVGEIELTGINEMKYELEQNYPNPFNPSTRISYSIAERGEVRILVYDILGTLVKELYRGEQDAGEYSIEFNANGLPSGVYMCRMEAGRYTKTIKMILMK